MALMAFRVYPDPQVRPLEVGAGGESPAVVFDELVGIDATTGLSAMFLRVVKLGGACAPSGPPHPTVRLRAGAGDAVEVPTFPITAAVFTGPGATGSHAGDATLRVEPGDVYRIVVFVDVAGSTWRIQLANRDDARAHGFTWVVADNDDDTRQPWIDVSPTLALDTLVGQPVTRPLAVANLGTGPLRIADRAGSSLGEGFVLTEVPAAIEPNACADIRISFAGAAVPGANQAVYTITSGDTTAKLAPAHNRRVTLSGATRRLPPGTIVVAARRDSGGAVLLGIDPASGAATAIPGGETFERPAAVVVDADETILVADAGMAAEDRGISRLDPVTGNRTTVIPSGSIPNVLAMALEPAGSLLVLGGSDSSTSTRLLRVDPTTGASRAVVDTIEVEAVAMALEAAGTVLVLARSRLVRVHLATRTVSTLPIGVEHLAQDVAVDTDGNIWVADVLQGAGGGFTFSEGHLKRLDRVTGEARTVSSGGTFKPIRITVGPGGKILATDEVAKAVLAVDPVSGLRTVLSTPSDGTPSCIAVVRAP